MPVFIIKQAYNVFQSQPKDYFSAISGKRIMEKVSDDKEFTAWYLYGLNSNGMALTFKEGLLRDKYANKKNPWFKADDMGFIRRRTGSCHGRRCRTWASRRS